MIDASDFVYVPYTRDLTEAGIAFALRSLPYSFGRERTASYDRLRRLVTEGAVEIAFRRYLAERGIPFEVKGALPFHGHDRYDVTLAGRRCEIKSFLISHQEQVSLVQCNPDLILKAPALVASDQHAAEGSSPRDLYLFTFLMTPVMISPRDRQNRVTAEQPRYLVHVMPEAW
ncbi:MAG TPA: hypothetical protein VK880_04900, partial [Anaerolineales bacterium]|nr:hypothetical protein [Anaerolineales bacterium]